MSNSLRDELQKLRSEKAIIITKTKGYLRMLLGLLDIDSPKIKNEISKIKMELDALVGSIFRDDTLLGILEKEGELIRLLRGEEEAFRE